MATQTNAADSHSLQAFLEHGVNRMLPNKRTFILLEILIGLTLMSILFAFLFTSMTRSREFETKIEKARSELLERQRFQSRLQDLFLTMKAPSLYTKRLLGDKNESLIAAFDHGIDPDPDFSGPVLARVYLDESRNLSLAIWPLEKEKKKRSWRNEILLSQVDDVELRFLGKKKEPGIYPVNAQFAWYDCWPESRGENPMMVRLLVRQKGTLLPYAFFFSNPEPLVTYWEGGYQS